ncbi:MAG TPA: hypothetical protein DDW20_02310 [Firmicutes bacterium]|nr:hypothetical protein [Bacillota bacterium]
MKNFKDLTETEKNEYVKKMRLNRELKNLKRSVESGKKSVVYRDCGKPISCELKPMTTEEIESAKRKITELENELNK